MSAEKLPEGWVNIELNEIASDISYGYTASSSVKCEGPHMLRITDIQNNTVNWSNVPFCQIEDKQKEKYLLADGDLVFARTGATVGKSFLIKGDIPESIYASYLIRVRCNGRVNKNFLSYFFRSPEYWNQITELSAGIGQPNVNGSKLKRLILPITSTNEQKIIAEKLDTLLAQVDSTKARLEQIPQILKRFRQAMLSAAVSGNISGENDKFKRIHVDDFWSHDVVGLTHWREYKFSEIVDIIGGSQPPKSEFKYEMEEGYIRLIQIRDYKSDSHKVYIPLNKAKRFVEKHDVMIGRYGPPIFQILRGLEGAYNVALMKAVPKSELLDNEYLYWFLQNYKLYNFIEAGSDRTAGQSGVNKKHLESYPVLLPPIHEQHEIVRRVEQLFAYADTIEKQVNNALARVNNLTQSILAKAFRGELTAQWRAENPELISGENSAAALLEKIKAERAASGGKKASRKKS
ncbi:TPA: hypothetical protein JLM45_002467 [Escherichia coli]|nr:hypothetical protein [Escherichia coli]